MRSAVVVRNRCCKNTFSEMSCCEKSRFPEKEDAGYYCSSEKIATSKK